jgi:hypothetical protein
MVKLMSLAELDTVETQTIAKIFQLFRHEDDLVRSQER